MERAVGEALARAGVEAPVVEIGFAFDRLPARAVERIVGFTADGSPLSVTLARLGPEASRAIREALVAGVAMGSGPAAIAREARAVLGGNLARALAIARTETIRAYREASREVYLQNRDVIGGWEWRASFSARTCIACITQSGRIYPLEEPMQSHPNCRCVQIPVVRRLRDVSPVFRSVRERERQEVTGRDWLELQPYDVKAAIMTPAVYEAYRSGAVLWGDLTKRRRDDRWGTILVPRPQRELFPDRFLRLYRQRAAETALRRRTDPFWFESRDLLDRMATVLPRILPGIQRRWNGHLEIVDTHATALGLKPIECHIVLVRQHLQNSTQRFITALHELIHGHSDFAGYPEMRGWEEGLAEAVTQLYASDVGKYLGVELDDRILRVNRERNAYRPYISALDTLRRNLNMSEQNFYGGLLRAPLRERPGLVQQWARQRGLARSSVWQTIFGAQDEALRSDFETLWRRMRL